MVQKQFKKGDIGKHPSLGVVKCTYVEKGNELKVLWLVWETLDGKRRILSRSSGIIDSQTKIEALHGV